MKHQADPSRVPPIPPDIADHYPEAADALGRYADLLAGPAIERGLIGPRETPRLWDRHIANSLALEALVPQGASVIDVGSGAGLPGWPLALVRPDLRVILLEPMSRRSEFLEECGRELGRPDVTILRARAQDATVNADIVVARAVAPMGELAAMAWGLVAPGGELLALKGERAVKEVAEAEASGALRALGVAAVDVLAIGDPATYVVRIRRGAGPVRT